MSAGNTFLILAALLWCVNLLPQMIKTYRTKDVQGISLLWIILSALAYIMFELGNIFSQNYSVAAIYLIPAAMNCVLCAMVIKYNFQNTNV